MLIHNPHFKPSFISDGIWRKMVEYRIIGGAFPTIFDIGILWVVNSVRIDGKFNLYFCWLYLLLMPFMLISSLCHIVMLVIVGRDNGYSYHFLESLREQVLTTETENARAKLEQSNTRSVS